MNYSNEKAEEDMLDYQGHGDSTASIMHNLENQGKIFSDTVTEESEGDKSDTSEKEIRASTKKKY